MSGEGTYAPKSPDLSSLFAGPAVSNHNNNNYSANSQDYYLNQTQDYHSQGRPNQQGLHLQPPQQNYYQQQQHQQPPPHSPSGSGLGGHPQPQPHHPHQQQQPPLNDPYSPRQVQVQVQQPLHQQYYTPTSPQQPQSGFGLPPTPQQQQQYYQPAYGEQQGFPYSAPAQPYSQPQFYDPSPAIQAPLQPPADLQPHQLDTSAMPPRRAAAQAPQPPVIEPSPVKTKFPTARIKRIMQADEEVGKVAQQTPIAVGKALELFMIALVTKSADVAKDKNSKRVTAQMLKHVVESDDQWDFLREIVGRVENDDKAKSGGRTKAESESDEEAAEAKKKAKGGRKKKA